MHISPTSRPRVVLTMGDPLGIGPEVIVKALASVRQRALADFFVVGDRHTIEAACRKASVDVGFAVIDLANVDDALRKEGPGPRSGGASLAYIDEAVRMIARHEADALVTGPVAKALIRDTAARPFIGHTEYLAQAAGVDDVVMMFSAGSMRVSVVTRHIPLSQVSSAVTPEAVSKTVTITYESLVRFFGIASPRVAVAGLNPHAGELGKFGPEEEAIIRPAVERLQRRMPGLKGPVPADTAFFDAHRGLYDAVVAMYHDQALAPFKMLHFRDGVNVTLGLPYVRTSPDHGTAFDIAGLMKADPLSMSEAILLAVAMTHSSGARER